MAAINRGRIYWIKLYVQFALESIFILTTAISDGKNYVSSDIKVLCMKAHDNSVLDERYKNISLHKKRFTG